MKPFRSRLAPSVKIFAAAKKPLGTRVPFRNQVHLFRSCEMAANFPRLEIHRFATEAPFRRVFRSCKTTLWHTSATSQHRTPISQLRNGLQKFPSSVKSTPRCENAPSFKMAMKMLQASKWATKMFLFFPWAAKMFFFFLFGCKMISKLLNGLQATKWFVKTPSKAKGSCENANRAPQPYI